MWQAKNNLLKEFKWIYQMERNKINLRCEEKNDKFRSHALQSLREHLSLFVYEYRSTKRGKKIRVQDALKSD